VERSEQIKICQQCKNRKMDFTRGLLCGLTNEFADFDGDCKDFIKDRNSSLKHITNQAYVSKKENDLNPDITRPFFYFILFVITLEVIAVLATKFNFNIYYQYTCGYTTKFLICLYVCHFLNEMKNGAISGLLFIASIGLLSYFPSVNHWTFGVLAFAIPLAYFAYQTLENRKQQILFLLAGIVFQKGLLLIYDLPFRNLRKISRALGQIYREFDQTFNFIAGILLVIIITGLSALLLIYVHKWVSTDYKWQLNKLSMQNVLPNRKMGLFVIIYYSAILLLSYSFITTIGPISYYINSSEFELFPLISYFIALLCSFLFFLFLIWQYRKVTLEYYLANNRQLAWNYLLAQVPVLNIFVWLHNLSIFKPRNSNDRNSIAGILNNEKFGIKMLFVLVSAIRVLFVITSRDVQAVDVIVSFADVFIVLFYISNKLGLYFIIGLELLLLFYVFTVSTLDPRIAESLISFSLFFNIARMIILYPLFHGREFTVEVPKQ